MHREAVRAMDWATHAIEEADGDCAQVRKMSTRIWLGEGDPFWSDYSLYDYDDVEALAYAVGDRIYADIRVILQDPSFSKHYERLCAWAGEFRGISDFEVQVLRG